MESDAVNHRGLGVRPINLRCRECGHIRTPVVLNPYLPPGVIVVLCDECHRRAMSRIRFYPDDTETPKAGVSRPRV